jgi:hypothetical protein
MFRQLTREKRAFIHERGDPLDQGSSRRIENPDFLQVCRVPVDIEDGDISRLDGRRERVLFRIPDSKLVEKYNVDDQ